MHRKPAGGRLGPKTAKTRQTPPIPALTLLGRKVGACILCSDPLPVTPASFYGHLHATTHTTASGPLPRFRRQLCCCTTEDGLTAWSGHSSCRGSTCCSAQATRSARWKRWPWLPDCCYHTPLLLLLLALLAHEHTSATTTDLDQPNIPHNKSNTKIIRH